MAGASAAAYWLAERGPRGRGRAARTCPATTPPGAPPPCTWKPTAARLTRGLAVAGRAFLAEPRRRASRTSPLITPRPVIYVGRADQAGALDRFHEENRAAGADPRPPRRELRPVRAASPLLREDYVGRRRVLEPAAEEIDVAALHQGFLRGLRARGGTVATAAEVTALGRKNGLWHAGDGSGRLGRAGAGQCRRRLVRCRVAVARRRRARSAFGPGAGRPSSSTARPADGDCDDWPMVHCVEDSFYLKPDAGRVLGSPADETPSEPCDAYPEELDVAIGADRIMQATTLEIRHIRNKWAGLRSFVADRQPVAGFDAGRRGLLLARGPGGRRHHDRARARRRDGGDRHRRPASRSTCGARHRRRRARPFGRLS